MTEYPEYIVQCWHCLAEFDALGAMWCSCPSAEPTKTCPFCLTCFCQSDADYLAKFWEGAPDEIRADRASLADRRRPLGEMLRASGRISSEELAEGLRRQAATGKKFGRCMVDLGLVDEDEISQRLGQQLAPVSFDLDGRVIDAGLAHDVGVEFCHERGLLPVERQKLGGRTLVLLAMADPSDMPAIERVEAALGARAIVGHAPATRITEILTRLFPRAREAGSDQTRVDAAARALLDQAVVARATHLRIRCDGSDGAGVQWAVDGVLHPVTPPSCVGPAHVQALQHWFAGPAGPEGRHIEVEGRHTLAFLHVARAGAGSTATVRFFDRTDVDASLAGVSLDAGSRLLLNRSLASRSGLVVLTGSAGSNTERTFWAIVNELAAADRHVVLFQAPLPHPSEHVRDGLTACGAALGDTAEPLVTERWDVDALALYQATSTADLQRAVREARQRLVVVRLDAREGDPAVDTLSRVVPAEESTSVLLVSIEQHSVRRICAYCFAPDPDGAAALQALGLPRHDHDVAIFRGTGCERCGVGKGYHGGEPVLIVRPGGESVSGDLVARRCESIDGAPATRRLRSLRDACVDLLTRGVTTPEEVARALTGARQPPDRASSA